MDTAHVRAGDQMAEIASDINSRLARFCELLAEADTAQEWLAEGSPDPAQWLCARFGFEPSYGRRLVRIARRLADLPELAKRFASGELSLDAVDILAEVATPDTELDLIQEAGGRDLHDLARLASRERPPTREDSVQQRDQDWMSTQWDLHRRTMKFAGQLAGVHAQVVEDRLIDRAKSMPKNPETGEHDDWSKRMANSLVEICATDAEGRAPLPTLVVHADLAAIGAGAPGGVSEISRGPVVSNELARMLGCDSAVEVAIHDEGKPIGIGRKSRKVPGRLRRQIEYRDHHCRFPGCGRTVFLQIHHLQHWADGGRTDFDRLVLLCWWHHIFIHDKGWHVTTDVDGRFVFRRPDWTPYPPRPT